jgi:hypothetical protein
MCPLAIAPVAADIYFGNENHDGHTPLFLHGPASW